MFIFDGYSIPNLNYLLLFCHMKLYWKLAAGGIERQHVSV